MESTPMCYKEHCDLVVSLLEVALPTLLCNRQVYPAAHFERAAVYGATVYQSRHPLVRKWIAAVLGAVGDALAQGTLRRTSVAIIDSRSVLPLEWYHFDIASVPPPQGAAAQEQPIPGALTERQVERMLRTLLMHIAAIDSYFTDIDEACSPSVSLVVETAGGEFVAHGAGGSGAGAAAREWMRIDPDDALSARTASACEEHGALLSMGVVQTGVVDVRLLAQECAAKENRVSQD